MFLVTAVIVGFVITGLLIFAEEINTMLVNRKQKSIKAKPGSNLSLAGQHILGEYNTLPEINRPYANMEYLLGALDVKYDINEVNKHFLKYNGWDYVFSWHCDCHNGGTLSKSNCPFREYYELHNDIKAITSELAKQEHALQVAGIQDGLDQIAELRAALKQETKLIRDTTKELVN